MTPKKSAKKELEKKKSKKAGMKVAKNAKEIRAIEKSKPSFNMDESEDEGDDMDVEMETEEDVKKDQLETENEIENDKENGEPGNVKNENDGKKQGNTEAENESASEEGDEEELDKNENNQNKIGRGDNMDVKEKKSHDKSKSAKKQKKKDGKKVETPLPEISKSNEGLNNGTQSAGEKEDDDSSSDEENKEEEAEKADDEAESPEGFAKMVGVGEGFIDDSDDDGMMEQVAIGLVPKETVSLARNDEAGLERKLQEIGIFCGKDSLSFKESLAVEMNLKNRLRENLAIDDLKREQKFAELATDAVHRGLEQLRKQKVKFRRPGDYFAEMVKSDTHMGKVKGRLLHEKERVEGAEKRRNNRDIAKNKKKVRSTQMEKEQEKKRKANEEIEAVKKLRKQRLKDREDDRKVGEDDEDMFPIDLLEVEQLDDENTFRPQKDIAEGKRKAWSGEKKGKATGKGQRGKNRTGWNKEKGSDGVVGGIEKQNNKGRRGKKKRLGKSRRKAGTKSK